MKKIDLHIHTISTIKDRTFTFDMEVLKDYVSTQKLDAIAITNHNVFDKVQYEDISNQLSGIVVFPGIEIDVESCHILFIASCDLGILDDFSRRCAQITPLIDKPEKSISFEDVQHIMGDYCNYLIIPHYDKEPRISPATLDKFGSNIFAGEVCSVKKFISTLKTDEKLTPVLFSDFRIETAATRPFPNRQTYVDTDVLTINNLKICLRDKTKVGLAPNDGHKLFQWSDDGACLSTGLNIVLGKRSSGKTHTLSRIQSYYGSKALYIRQFSLLNTQDPNSINQFEKEDKIRQERISDDFLKPFKTVVEDICRIPSFESELGTLNDYMSSLQKFANEQHLNDVYSKTRFFNCPLLVKKDEENLKRLIESIGELLNSSEYRSIIEKHVSTDSLSKLLCELISMYRNNSINNCLIEKINDAMGNIKTDLKMKSIATRIPDVDLLEILLNVEKRCKFNRLANELRKPRIIDRRSVSNFNIRTTTRPYRNATDMKQGHRVSLTDAYGSYENGIEFVNKLLSSNVESTELYKYFVKVEFNILNEYGTLVSGGERTEFNFLSKVKDAMEYDILIIDEPESSFDNVFLKDKVNKLIKEMSGIMPVVVSTHNSTLGGSINPDYVLYTEKKMVDGNIRYRVYEGTPTSKQLKSPQGDVIENYTVTMDSLEAGETAYQKRKESYDLLKN